MPTTDDDDVHDDARAESARADLRRILEAVLMVAEEPADPGLLGELCEVRPAIVEETLTAMAAEYEDEGRGFTLVKIAGGWRFQSDEWANSYVERFVLTGQSARLSAAALETLAIVAYKQPISRAQVASIRGVNVDGVIRTLSQRGYIAEVGQDPGPGQAVLFGTTGEFLERLGLNTLEELPSLGDFIPGADVVEQLEDGLRLDSEPEAGPAAATPTPSGSTSESTAVPPQSASPASNQGVGETSLTAGD